MSQKKRLHLITYGCQMNKYDSRLMAGILGNKQYEVIDNPASASLILINTCSIRQHAEQRVFSHLGRLSLLKRGSPGVILGLCGCMAQRLGSNLLKRFPALDLVVGPNNIGQLQDLLLRVEKGERVVAIDAIERDEVDCSKLASQGLKAFVPVSFGCDKFCSYCIVPYVRGRYKSRKAGDILEEIRGLVNTGTVEVTLLGQNINSYGQDSGDNLVELLKQVNQIDDLKRIRFLTSHPADVKQDLIEAVRELNKVCKHFHLPIQSGSNKILRLMQRGYSVETYLELVEEIRRQIPGVAITTDLIIGFPGEGEKEFEETLSLVQRIRFDGAFSFKFSPRLGTKAASLIDDLREEDKTARLERLIGLQKKISREKNDSNIGQIEEVLVEGVNPKDASCLLGRSGTDKVVSLSGPDELIGQIVKVRIESAVDWCLKGGEAFF